MIEPHTKGNASPNKQWGWGRWSSLVGWLPNIDWVQLGPPGTCILDGARHIITADFVSAIAVLSGARAAVKGCRNPSRYTLVPRRMREVFPARKQSQPKTSNTGVDGGTGGVSSPGCG